MTKDSSVLVGRKHYLDIRGTPPYGCEHEMRMRTEARRVWTLHTHCFHGRDVPGRVWVCRRECDLVERVVERLGDGGEGLEVVVEVLCGLE